jgi:hypothetical protein
VHGNLGEQPEVVLDPVGVPVEGFVQHPFGVAHQVRRQPERELGRVDRDTQAIGERVAGGGWRRRPGPVRAVAAGYRTDQDVDVVDDRDRVVDMPVGGLGYAVGSRMVRSSK